MRTIIDLKGRYAIYVIMTILLSHMFSACESIEEDNWVRPTDMTPYIPDDCIYWIGNWNVSGNTASFYWELKGYGLDYWNLRIKSIDYYIDDKFIKSDTQEPFSFEYTTTGLDKGEHKVIMKVKIEDMTNNKEIIITPYKNFEITSDNSPNPNPNPNISDKLSVNASWSRSGKNVTFNINSVQLSSSMSEDGWMIESANFYIDENLINTISDAPYVLNYTAKDLSRGDHKFIIKVKAVNAENEEMELVYTIDFSVNSGMNFYIDYNQYIKNGEPLMATPYFLDERSERGCDIKSVTYYVDKEEVETKTSAPFSISYNLPKDDESHNLSVSISYSDGTDVSRSHSFSFNGIRFMESDTHEYAGGIKGSNSFFVGDVLSCYAKVYRGELIEGTDEVDIYLDDALLTSSKTFPYSYDLKLDKSHVGSHSLRYEWKSYDGGHNVIKSQTIHYNGLIVSE